MGTCATLAPVSGAFAGGVLALQGAVALKEQHPEMTQYHIIQTGCGWGRLIRWKKRQR